MRRWWFLWLGLLVAGAGLGAADGSSLLTATGTGPMVLGVPWVGATTPRVWIRGASGAWQPASFKQTDGRLIFALDPARLGGPTVLLLINPPAGLQLNDDRPPALVGLKLDGKSRAMGSVLDLGTGKTVPRQLVAVWRDRENAVDPKSVRVLVDGVVATAGWRTTQGGAKEVRLSGQLPELDYGKHEIVLSARDTSPQANEAKTTIRLQRLDTTNLALASLGAKVQVDSCFAGYESLTPLNDGNTTMPGDSCGNDIAWASAETDTDHWAEVTLAKPAKLSEVTIYWAAYTQVKHTPRHFEVQVPDGEGWRAIYKSPAGGEKPKPATTVRFAPMTADRFRVFMPKGMGSEARPRLLWIGEIQAR